LSAPHLLVDLNIIGRFTQHLLVDLKTFDRFSNLHLLAGLKKKSNNKSTAIVPLKLSKPYIFTLFFKLKLNPINKRHQRFYNYYLKNINIMFFIFEHFLETTRGFLRKTG